MGELDQLNKLISDHLSAKNCESNNEIWRIEISPLGGRGLFANRDLKSGETIFIDHPLLIGPRSRTNVKIHCVNCSKTKNIRVCSHGCGLPLCSDECEKTVEHLKECELIRKWLKGKKFTEISVDIFRVLMLLRAFLLEDTSFKLLNKLTGHIESSHAKEFELIKKNFILSESNEEILKQISSILDINVFETIVQIDNNNRTSLRAIYPLSAMMNHSCIPNTTYAFDNNQKMIVKAIKSIPKNTEILTTYTSLLWGTTSRRFHLSQTKHFWCLCDRCKDPKEFGACLSGLKCIIKPCVGTLFPANPLDISSNWECDICSLSISSQKIGIIQSSLGGLLKTIDVTDLEKLICFLKDRLSKVVPLKNQIAVEIKLKIVWILGNTEKYLWTDISNEHLNFKEGLCRELLQLLNDLHLGQSTLRGQILYELYRCLKEKSQRILNDIDIKFIEDSDAYSESRKIILEAAEILADDITAPKELIDFINCKNGTELCN